MEKIYDLVIPADQTRGLDLSCILNEKKLMHLHPHWFVGDCVERDNRLFVSLKDYETEEEFQLGLHVDFLVSKIPGTDIQAVMRITLSEYAISELLFYSERGMMHVKITGSDVVDERLEQSMYLWIRSIQEYIRLYVSRKLSVLVFRLIMNRMILQTIPSQRKISGMIAKITAVEILVIVVIVVGYFLFVQKS